METVEIVMGLIFLFGFVVLISIVLRMVGAWLFRINEVIEELREMNTRMKVIAGKIDEVYDKVEREKSEFHI